MDAALLWMIVSGILFVVVLGLLLDRGNDGKPIGSMGRWLNKQWFWESVVTNPDAYGWALLLFGLANLTFPLARNWPEWLKNLGPESVGIGVTILLIDFAVRKRDERNAKAQLTRDLLSSSNDFALRAINELKDNGWFESVLTENKHKLIDVRWQGCNLRGVKLQNVYLTEAHMQKSRLEEAQVVGAWLINCQLQSSSLRRARIEKTNIYSTDFQAAILWEATLRGIGFSQCLFQDANLIETDLRDSHLVQVDLRRAKMQRARLQRAKIDHSNLEDADLSGAYLHATTISRSHLNGTSLRQATYTKDTIWPDDFDPKVAGAILVEWDETAQDWVPVEDGGNSQELNMNGDG